MEPTKEILTPADVAAWLGVPLSTLQLWRGRRTGPEYTRLGRSVRYERNKVVEFIAAGRVETAR